MGLSNMKTCTVDKRIIKTRGLIKMTVADMLKKHPIEDISVSDVAKNALIQRATFYNHYSNVSEVVYDIWKDITEQAEKGLAGVDFSAIRKSVGEIFCRISQIYNMLEPEYRMFLRSGNCLIMNGVRKWFIDNTIKKVEKHQRPLTEYEKYAARMYINGVIDSFILWNEAHPEGSRDINEFISYAVKVADNACMFIGIK